jgi:tRNA pseudouridine13 synthase
MSDTPKRAISPTGDSVEETSKRAKLDSAPATTETQPTVTENLTYPHTRPGNETIPPVVSKMGLKPVLPVMPPSLELVTGVKADLRARKGFVGQEEVGILGYAGDPAFKGVRGVIKQR